MAVGFTLTTSHTCLVWSDAQQNRDGKEKMCGDAIGDVFEVSLLAW